MLLESAVGSAVQLVLKLIVFARRRATCSQATKACRIASSPLLTEAINLVLLYTRFVDITVIVALNETYIPYPVTAK